MLSLEITKRNSQNNKLNLLTGRHCRKQAEGVLTGSWLRRTGKRMCEILKREARIRRTFVSPALQTADFSHFYDHTIENLRTIKLTE